VDPVVITSVTHAEVVQPVTFTKVSLITTASVFLAVGRNRLCDQRGLIGNAEVAGVDNAGVDISARYGKGGHWTLREWTIQEWSNRHCG